jgi:hypothetical protein
MQRKRCDDEFAVADLVANQTADDDAETESGEPSTADQADLRGGEAELACPVIEDAAADAEAHAGGEYGHEARPQQPLGVGCDGLVTDLNVARHRRG